MAGCVTRLNITCAVLQVNNISAYIAILGLICSADTSDYTGGRIQTLRLELVYIVGAS